MVVGSSLRPEPGELGVGNMVVGVDGGLQDDSLQERAMWLEEAHICAVTDDKRPQLV